MIPHFCLWHQFNFNLAQPRPSWPIQRNPVSSTHAVQLHTCFQAPTQLIPRTWTPPPVRTALWWFFQPNRSRRAGNHDVTFRGRRRLNRHFLSRTSRQFHGWMNRKSNGWLDLAGSQNFRMNRDTPTSQKSKWNCEISIAIDEVFRACVIIACDRVD